MVILPYAILKISRPSGELLYSREQHAPEPKQTIDPKYVGMMNSMLNNVVLNGTGRRSFMDFMPSGGKTGTTSAYRDAWFMGITSHYVTGVWFGNDNYTPMARVTGGSLPAQTWREFMVRALEGKPMLALHGVPISSRYAVVETPEAQTVATTEQVIQQPQAVNRVARVLSNIAQLFLEIQEAGNTAQQPVKPLSSNQRTLKRRIWSTALPASRFTTSRKVN